MKIIIDTDYDCGQEVWVWKQGKPELAKVTSIVWSKYNIPEGVKYHVSCDDLDYYRYEEELFTSKEECMEAMGVKAIKIDMATLKRGNIIECIRQFKSTEGDSYEENHIYCIARINHNSAIVTRGKRGSKYNYCLLYRDEIADNFKLHKVKIKGNVINSSLRVENFEEVESESKS